MQHQIANAVGFRVYPPPNLIVAELFKAALNFRQIFGAQEMARIPNKGSRGILRQVAIRVVQTSDLFGSVTLLAYC